MSNPGQNPNTNTKNNPPPGFLRRASPFVRRPRNPLRPHPNGRPSPSSGGIGSRGSAPGSATGSRVASPSPRPGSANGRGNNNISVKKEQSDEPELFQEFSIKACTREEIENIQYHLMKIQSRQPVNPVKDFTKPIRLHRKDPRNMQFQLTLKEIDEREKLNKELKAQQEARRSGNAGGASNNNIVGGTGDSSSKDKDNDVNMSAVFDLDAEQQRIEQEEEDASEATAPSIAPEPEVKPPTNVAPEKQRNKNKRKTREVRVLNEDARKLRYEEYYPWVMEDYDGQNTFVGNYEAATTVGHNHALLVPTADGGFKMIPINKIYKFTPRNKYATLTLEEAEAKLANNQGGVSRWLMSKLDKDEDVNKSRTARNRITRTQRMRSSANRALFGDDDDDDDDDEQKRYSDNEGMDFDEEFADDEEAPIVGDNDDEEKESRRRMEKEMQRANTGLEVKFDDDENDGFEDEENKRKFDKEGKKLKKTLVKNEYGQVMYDSDEEENPYLSQSDLETSDEEKEENKEGEQAEGEANAANGNGTTAAGGVGAGANKSSKTGTPVPHVPQIAIKLPVNNPIGVVTIKASASILGMFPRGEWNPQVSKKRNFATALQSDSSATGEQHHHHVHKKAKVKSPSPDSPRSPLSPRSPSSPKSPRSAAGSDIESNGDTSLITQDDIVTLIKNNKLTTKELFQRLRDKIVKNKANKEIFKTLIKKLAKVKTLEDGTKILILKNPEA